MSEDKLKKSFILSVDDFGFLLPGLDILLRLKKTYPKFKITAFTIPLPKQFLIPENRQYFSEEKYKKWAKIINSYDWLEVAIHGLFHTKREMDVDYKQAIDIIKAAENTFNKIGLKFVKVFKAPYWQYSWHTLKALRDMGYVVALDRNHPLKVPDYCDTYYYNWSYEEKLPDEEIIKGHGHLFGNRVANNMETVFGNILHNIPKDANFKTIYENFSNNS